jgi:aarF domain-containing kinase
MFAMAGKRLLDIAALYNASRGVAQKHIAFRGRQLDVYNRTSTLAKAVRNQTDRFTETAKAASFLASRLNESAPAWTSEATGEQSAAPSKDGETIPRKDAAVGKASSSEEEEGLERDHFYERSQTNSALDQKPTEDLEIQQETADRYPLPDGTIPPTESNINFPAMDHDVVSTKPKDEPLKTPLDEDGLKPASSSTSSIPTPTSRPLSSDTARRIQRQSEEQIPSRTADALGETTQDPLEEGHDEDSFYRTSGHTSPTLSSLPRFKIPKHPSNTQGFGSKRLNSDTFYNAGEGQNPGQIPSVEAVPEKEEIPEGINTDLFYSPRIAKMLGGKTHGDKERDVILQEVSNTRLQESDLAEDKGTFDARTTSQELASDPGTFERPTESKADIEKFAQDLADEIKDQSAKVRLHKVK